MFETALAQITGLVSSRFKLNAFFPALVASLLGLALTLVATIGVDSGVGLLTERSGFVKVGLVIFAIAAVYALAVLLESQTLTIVRSYEGYRGPLKWSGQKKATGWHFERRRRLQSNNEDAYRSEYAASATTEDEMLPTRLGNVLRSGEYYGFERYGANIPVVWPRLLPLVPEPESTSLALSRAAMEQLLILSLILSIFGSIGGVVFALQPHSTLWSLGSLVGGWILAGLLYRGAVDQAISYSLQLKAIVDAHRLKVLTALQIPSPRNLAEERRRWSDVTAMLAQNVAESRWPYANAETKGSG